MATSNESPAEAPSYSDGYLASTAKAGQNQSWEVFISHRGADKLTNTNIKKTFVSFLHARLTQAGIKSFMDERSLEPGNPAWDTMLEAVRQCSIAIPVLSEGYGNSEWCLRELTTMVAAKRHIEPLFLDEAGVDVLKKIRAGSSKLRAKAEPGEFELWQAAINAMEALTGWRPDQTNGFQAPLVDILVARIVEQLGHQSLPVPKRPVAMEERAEPVRQALRQHDVVGLYGMGGIGKTTVANVIFNQLRHGYNSCCYVEVSQSAGAQEIQSCQQQMLKKLCGLEGPFHGVQQNKCELEQRLGSQRVLLVLDDVWSPEQLEALLVQLGPQSKAIVTSRDLGLLQRTLPDLCSSEPQYIPIGLLSPHDGQVMLCLHAFGRPAAPGGLEKLAAEAASACSGLPLALRVIGSYLSVHQDPRVWKGAVHKLRHAQELDGRSSGSIFHTLRVSYDVLDIHTQDMLMDIACVLLGQTALAAVRSWDAAAFLGLENLQSLSLITVENGILGMHDQIRDMLRSLAGTASMDRHAGWYAWDEQAAAILIRCKTSQLQGINVMGVLGQACLEDMCHLRLLLRSDEDIYQAPSPGHAKQQASRPAAHESLIQLPQLRFLQTNDIQLLRGLRAPALSVLRVVCWPLEGMPESIGHLTGLEHLEVAHCSFLQGLPESIGQLTQLQFLALTQCSSLQSLPESIGQLTGLRYLDLFGCDSLHSLPESICRLASLDHLKLSYCDSLQSLPDSTGRIKGLQVLKLVQCCSLQSLPDSIGQMTSLWLLQCSQCSSLQSLPESIGQATGLRILKLDQCSSLQSLPESIGQLMGLVIVNLYQCSSLQSLPDSMSQLIALGVLDLTRCGTLQSLPGSLGQLPGLKYLGLSQCSSLQLQRLPESIRSWTNLEHLDSDSLLALTELLDRPIDSHCLDFSNAG